jgi:alpha-beta hydrolase superfamily lysophospholipase
MAQAGGTRPTTGWQRVLRWLRWPVAIAALLVVAIVFGSAFLARRHPDLEPWHRLVLAHEVDTASAQALDWTAYVAREDALFAELDAAFAAKPVPGAYRYESEARVHVPAGEVDWNRSYAGAVPAQPRGGVLLLHGLSDSPYSLHHVARIYERAGFVVLMPRLPGHGTVPAGLLDAQWQDWLAVVELSMRELRARTGTGTPLHVVGYSNGGALALKYALDRASGRGGDLPPVARLVLLSPMVGVDSGARYARLLPLLGGFDYFEKSLWLDVQPEFNPFKYNSFPVNAVRQSWTLTTLLQAQLLELKATGRADRLPPLLVFQSVLDSTVSTPAVVRALFDHLPANGSELVLFDINRRSLLAPMFTDAATRMLDSLQPADRATWRLTVVGNAAGDSLEVAASSRDGSGTVAPPEPLGLAWPADVYSLSHIALPFPPDDPLYGLQPRARPDYGIRLGTLRLHGERGALGVGAEQLMRIGSNPFFPYVEHRIDAVIASDVAAD